MYVNNLVIYQHDFSIKERLILGYWTVC